MHSLAINMKALAYSETVLEGKWLFVGDKMVSDEATLRIEELVVSYLIHVATCKDGWAKLYRDPADGRYWEHTYPQSEMHGGGPPKLQVMEHDAAAKRYGMRLDV